MITTDALNYLLRNIEHATDDALLTVTLTRLAIICAGLPGASGWLDLFEREFRLERGRRRLQKALPSTEGFDLRVGGEED